eukprot:scaffold4331_cov400-Prasinococcus_capsulatus_cf.AAC.2
MSHVPRHMTLLAGSYRQRCGRTTWTKTCYSRAIISYLCGIRRRLFAPGIRLSRRPVLGSSPELLRTHVHCTRRATEAANIRVVLAGARVHA